MDLHSVPQLRRLLYGAIVSVPIALAPLLCCASEASEPVLFGKFPVSDVVVVYFPSDSPKDIQRAVDKASVEKALVGVVPDKNPLPWPVIGKVVYTSNGRKLEFQVLQIGDDEIGIRIDNRTYFRGAKLSRYMALVKPMSSRKIVGMESIGMALGVFAVVAMLVVDAILIAMGLRNGACGVDGWGTFRRESEPIPFWVCMTFHVGVAVALSALLVAAASSFFP